MSLSVFGEGLPNRFFERISDFTKADLLIVLGTSLQVQPFAKLIDRVPLSCPRVLINLERVGEIASYGASSAGLDRFFGGMRGAMNETGFDFEGFTLGKGKGKEHIRDVFYQGKCDEGILELAKWTGWEKELKEKHSKLVERLDKEKGSSMAGKTVTAEESADKAAEKMAADMNKAKLEATPNLEATPKKEEDSADAVAGKLAELGIGEEKRDTSSKDGTSSL